MDWKIDLPAADIGENMVQCSFCNSSQTPKEEVFSNTDEPETSKDPVFICYDCVRLGASQVDLQTPVAEPEELENPRTCNFCQRQQEFAEGIFVANEGKNYICTDCVTRFAQSLPAS